MMKLRIESGRLAGRITPPSSKSLCHRYFLLAAVAEGESFVACRGEGEDLLATLDLLRLAGVRAEKETDGYRIFGRSPDRLILHGAADVRSSGSTLRLSLPLLLLSGEAVSLRMSEQLAARPLGVYADLFCDRGIFFEKKGTLLSAKGKPTAGEYVLPGDLSSQFASGLLLSLPFLAGDSTLRFSTPIESRPYIDLTLKAMRDFGLSVEASADGSFRIPGGQRAKATTIAVEPDAGAAASFRTLCALGENVECCDFSGSLQGDARVEELLTRLKEGRTVDLSDTPDLAPLLFVAAAILGEGHFTGTRRLAFKESDRVASMQEELAKCGAWVAREENAVRVFGKDLHAPKEVLLSHDDHRVAMALAVLLLRFGGELDGAECVGKSYPDFWQDLASLGATVKML